MFSKFLHIILLLFCPLVYGQFVYTKTYTTDDGLLSNEINALYQDSRGLLWIGSKSGLLVKTMDQFLGIVEVNQNKFNNIKSIIEDDAHNIWIGSSSHGVMKLKGNDESVIFNKKNGLISDEVTRMFHFKSKIYIGTQEGLSVLDTKTQKSINLLPENLNTQSVKITSIFTYKDQIFVCTEKAGIFEVHLSTQKLKSIIPFNGVYSVLPFGNEIYYASNKGILKYNAHTHRKINYYDIPYAWGYDIKNQSTIYFVSSGDADGYGGLFQINNDKVTNLTKIFDLPHDDLISIAIDNSNNKMYLGTKQNGLLEVYFDNPLKKVFDNISVHSLSSGEEHLFMFSSEGLKIFNTSTQKERFVPLKAFKTFQLSNRKISEKMLKSIGISSTNNFYSLASKITFYRSVIYKKSVWVSSNIGLFELSFQGEFLNHYPIFSPLFDFYKDQLIDVAPEGGLRLFTDLNRFEHQLFSETNSRVSKDCVDLIKIGNKIFIASSTKGLFVFDGEKVISLAKANYFSENKLKKLLVDNKNQLLVVTEYDDIFEINPDTYQNNLKYPSNKLKGKGIQSVIQSNDKLFVGTNKGINIFEKDKHYLMDKEQGLASYNYTSMAKSNGNIYLGTRDGLYKITEYFENVVNDYIPRIRVYDVIINGESIDKSLNYSWYNLISKKIELPFDKNNIRILFTDWSAKFPKKINFRYRLKKDKQWSNVLPKKEIDLNYLEPGEYEIELEIENLSTGKKYYQNILHIIIKPSFYQTWTFYGLMTVFLLIGTFFIYRYRLYIIRKRESEKNELLMRQKEEEKRRIEMEKEKVVLESRLSQTRMKALRSQMNPHFIFNALNTLQFFIISQDRNKGLTYLSKFSKLVRDTLENSINDYILLSDEVQYLKVYTSIENMRFEDRQIHFEFEIEDGIDVNQVLVPPMISQPFVENSILHAFDESILHPKITFMYSKKEEYLVCEIIDNGIGFDGEENEVNKHVSRGMSLVKERLELLLPDLEDAIEIKALENGTYVRIVLPYILKENVDLDLHSPNI